MAQEQHQIIVPTVTILGLTLACGDGRISCEATLGWVLHVSTRIFRRIPEKKKAWKGEQKPKYIAWSMKCRDVDIAPVKLLDTPSCLQSRVTECRIT